MDNELIALENLVEAGTNLLGYVSDRLNVAAFAGVAGITLSVLYSVIVG